MKLTDRTNQKYGKLTAIARGPDTVLKTGLRRVQWVCQCECGNEVLVEAANLGSGHTKSCGCMVKAACTRNFKSHGLTETKAYRAWCAMKNRCSNTKIQSYKLYGARGIKVCDKWANSFEAFIEDMGHPPTPSHSLDRIDFNGNYDPENCRWSDSFEQANNKRNNKWHTFDGKTLTEAQWARELGLSVSALRCRIKTWPLEKALSTPRLRSA